LEHELKIWPEHYSLIDSNIKQFEIRRNDRDYRAGDTVHMREWNPDKYLYTGKSLRRKITCVVVGASGLRPGYCVIGLTTVTDDPQGKEERKDP